MERYSFEKAQKEAAELQDKVKSGEAADYDEAEQMLEAEIAGNETFVPFAQRVETTLNGLGESAIGGQNHITIEDYYNRLLPAHFIPSDEKIEQAHENGVELEDVIYNTSNGMSLVLNGQIGRLIRDEVKVARKTLKGEDLQKRYDEIYSDVLARVFDVVPLEHFGDFQNGSLQIRSTTICKQPETCMRGKEEFGAPGLPEETAITRAAEMIDFAELDWEDLLESDDSFVLNNQIRQSGQHNDTKPPRTATSTRERQDPVMNDLQKFRYQMGRAMQSGKREDWDAVSEQYIHFMDHLPQYAEHRLAVLDLIDRVRSEQIQEMPEKILSVASGPYEEARAQMDLEFLYEKYHLDKPEIFNIDLSLDMLKHAEDAYEDKAITDSKKDYWGVPTNIVGDMRSLPVKEESFEMVECSSLDNLTKRSPEEVDGTLREMVRVLKPGGILRISHKEQLPDSFFEKLEQMGLTLITDPHTTYGLNDSLQQKLFQDHGAHFVKRLQQKVRRNAEYILAQKERNITLDETVLFNEEDLTSDTLRPTNLELANKLKESIEYFMDLEGGGKLFNENRRKRTVVPFKNLRKDIIFTTVESLVNDAEQNLAVIHGVPYSLKDKLAHLYGKVSDGNSDTLSLEEIKLLDRQYREDLLKRHAAEMFKQLVSEGVIVDESASK